ncbi:uncharacterized protein LOC117344144 [Pecten maximus]|uniref:uncharacterized protein LOC117344144 n=1 Tax=Pecten maximus TaxID=6579 RepID=UPI0014589667|nr:uncharacterized protein LOC117344144 [Pecten maximus]
MPVIHHDQISQPLNVNAQNFNHSVNTNLSGHQLSSSSSVSSQFHKLPKLILPTFDGDILQWKTFWDSFQSTIHFNICLTDIHKFSYLKAQLHGQASRCIEGLPITNDSYLQAVDILLQRFGQTHKVTNAYMEHLINIPAPRFSASSLRSFHDKIESYIRGLKSLGQCEESFGSLLVPIIKNKLPPNVRQNITRDNGGDNWELKSLREAISKEVPILEAGETEPGVVPTATFVTGTSDTKKTKSKPQYKPYTNAYFRKPCLFCRESHSPNQCTNVTNYKERIDIVKSKNVCFNCFGSHKVSNCHSKFKCKKCGKRHRSSICNDQLPQPSNPEVHVEDGNKSNDKEENSAALHSTNITSHSDVLLKTAISSVWSESKNATANILLVEGAHNSFMTEDLAKELEIETTGNINMKIAAFGGSESQIRRLKTARVCIESVSGERIPIEVVIIPKIAAPIEIKARINAAKLPYLRELQLAHPVTQHEKFNISLLIGADYYWSIVQDNVIHGNGPTAVKSKLGYLRSGPIITSKNSTSAASSVAFMITAIMNILTNHKSEEFDLEKFWKIESLGVMETPDTSTSKSYLQEYQDTSMSFQNGRYTAKLPWREDHQELPTNEFVTRNRTLNVMKRLAREPNLLKIYGDICIERVSDDNVKSGGRLHYIPHHPVKKDSTTTPIRIVFDCSCHQDSESPSLNDCLSSTPPELNDLTGLIARFRVKKFGVSTDIEKAFLTVALDEGDRDVTRFFWLRDPSNPNGPLITYRFKAVLFGALTCSPFILSATLLKHLNDSQTELANNLQRNLYVDNIHP